MLELYLFHHAGRGLLTPRASSSCRAATHANLNIAPIVHGRFRGSYPSQDEHRVEYHPALSASSGSHGFEASLLLFVLQGRYPDSGSSTPIKDLLGLERHDVPIYRFSHALVVCRMASYCPTATLRNSCGVIPD